MVGMSHRMELASVTSRELLKGRGAACRGQLLHHRGGSVPSPDGFPVHLFVKEPPSQQGRGIACDQSFW